MKRLSLLIVALALLTIPSALSATTKNVDITQAGFTPGKVTIDYGDTVTWTNKDAGNHQVLADQLTFPTSPVLAQNQTYSYTFTKSGSFGYRDALHTNRRGTVVVRAGVSITATPSLLAYGKSATVSGSISSFDFLASATKSASVMVALKASRSILSRSAGRSGGATNGRPMPWPA